MAKGNYKDHFINSADGQFTITDNQNNTIISIAIYHKFYTLEVGGDKISHHNLFLAPFPPTAESFKEPMTLCGASEVYEKRLQIWCDETEDCQNEKRAQARDDIISARVKKTICSLWKTVILSPYLPYAHHLEGLSQGVIH
ncbi:hypothetical protein SGGMMB4_03699 [Sodalis glossinidius str. 'morsitans']|uniref:Uncharacterized protein n=1 Tax=Sodalis glossinidius (strain morsitans) TaxID=343509 RepID=A0A193QKI6_SODGM|nr:hypothetical protein [Sodalis glossinidius]CRL45704.1 hypothetical protein SGGMMB4_03699 [Sodalis glossinidius str. 'morsitans']